MTTTEKIEKTNSSSFINKLASNPKIFIFLRRCLEFNFVGERKVINREFNELNSNSPILDLGCGTGEFSEFFNPEVYLGIDINKDYIDFASNNYPHKFKVMDANHLEFDTNSFENIFVFGVFHHLPDNQVFKIMEEVKRVLKPGGKLLVMEDIDDCPKYNLIGKLLHKLDVGEYIRKSYQYAELFSKYFEILHQYPMRSGFCDYQVFVLHHKK